MIPGRSIPSTVLVVPSRTPPEPPAPDLLTDRTAARPKPPGARGNTDRDGRPGTTPPVPGRPAFLSSSSLPLASRGLRAAHLAGRGRRPAAQAGRADRPGVVGHGPGRLAEFLADLGNMQVALPVLGCAVVVTRLAAGRPPGVPLYAASSPWRRCPALVVPLKDWTARTGPLTGRDRLLPVGPRGDGRGGVRRGGPADRVPHHACGAVEAVMDDARRRCPADSGDGHRSGAARLSLAAGRARPAGA